MNRMTYRYLFSIALSAVIGAATAQPTMLAAAPALAAQTTNAPSPATGPNPFFSESTLPFQAPPFDKIKDSDYQPAIEEGMRRQLAEVEAIANSAEPPTFANTVEAMERSGALLTRVSHVFFGLTQADTNPTLQKVESEETPRLAAHQDKIYMNPRLFARVKSLYDGRGALGLDAEGKFLVE